VCAPNDKIYRTHLTDRPTPSVGAESTVKPAMTQAFAELSHRYKLRCEIRRSVYPRRQTSQKSFPDSASKGLPPNAFTMRVPRTSLFFLDLTSRNRICGKPVGLGARSYSVHQRAFDDSYPSAMRPKVTLAHLRKMYMTNQKIAVMTAYDYPSGTFADRARSDIVLVGDSLGMVALGYESTNQVTLSVLSSLK